jgi:hypothetical protein
MTHDPNIPKRGPSDATDYSSTTAPETRQEAEERDAPTGDHRLQPGGAHGARCDPGMSMLDRDVAISGGLDTGQTRYGDRTDE